MRTSEMKILLMRHSWQKSNTLSFYMNNKTRDMHSIPPVRSFVCWTVLLQEETGLICRAAAGRGLWQIQNPLINIPVLSVRECEPAPPGCQGALSPWGSLNFLWTSLFASSSSESSCTWCCFRFSTWRIINSTARLTLASYRQRVEVTVTHQRIPLVLPALHCHWLHRFQL